MNEKINIHLNRTGLYSDGITKSKRNKYARLIEIPDIKKSNVRII